MKKPPLSNRRSIMVAAAAFSVASGAYGQLQHGDLDLTFTPTLPGSGLINTAVPQSDGSILIGGQFLEMGTGNGSFAQRFRMARFTSGGALDPNYAPDVTAVGTPVDNIMVYNIMAMPDETAFACGVFLTVNVNTPTPATRRVIARFQKNGVVHAGFTSAFAAQLPLSSITSMAPTAAGNILISTNNGLHSLKPTGAVNGVPDFYSSTGTGAVVGALVMQDQKIMLWGPFPGTPANPIGINTPYLDIIAENGRYRQFLPTPPNPVYYPDVNPFSPVLGPDAYCAVVQADKKILVGGRFGFPRVGLIRLQDPSKPMTLVNNVLTPDVDAKGTQDTDFNQLPDDNENGDNEEERNSPLVRGAVRAIALQADGKILIGGDFTQIRGTLKVNGQWEYETRYGIARLLPDGSIDKTFNANIQPIPGAQTSGTVTGISIQADGKILITGTFQRFGDGSPSFTSRPLIARLMNGPATQTLTSNGTSITWMRGGTSPEAQSVYFETRLVGTDEWVPVDGFPQRITGGWQRNNLSIAPGSYIRASARTTGGLFNGSSGIVSATYAYQIPRIGLRRDPLTFLTNNATTDLGSVGVTRPRDFAFTVSNPGTAALNTINATITGTHASQFSVKTAPATSLTPSGSTPLIITFNPTSTGAKTATLRITSSDPETPTFTVTLTGTAVSAIEGFRYEYFNTIANTGTAADDQDPDGDGQTNLFEFVAGLNPTNRTSRFQQRVENSGGSSHVIFSPRLADRTYEVWNSTTLDNDWALTPGTSADNGTERTFTDSNPSNPKRFYRVKIIRP